MAFVTRPPVVLITGQLLTAEVWAPQIEPLSGNYDLSFADHGRDDSIAGMAKRLLQEAPPSFHLVAHAMGGFVAFEAMRLDPRRIRSLVLMSTLASADTPTQTARRMAYLELVEKGRFETIVEERIPILVHPSRTEDETLLNAIRRMATDTGASRFRAQQRAIMGRRDSRPMLPHINVPVLIMHGVDDRITTAEHQHEMLSNIPGARLSTIEASGHLMTLEKPSTTSRILKEWLASRC